MLWHADPKFWARHAPVLFPIVGRLKDHKYEFEGKSYSLPQHGFARDSVFHLVQQTSNRLEFSLRSNEKTKENYPFDFEFRTAYQLDGNKLTQTFCVTNLGASEMLFSVGAHPAFAMPKPFQEYDLSFEKAELNLKQTTLKEGLLDQQQNLMLENDRILSLNHELFENDALVFEQLNSKSITLNHGKEKMLTMEFEGFPHFGIWTKPGAPFICLEPWLGHADKVDASGKLSEKAGISSLDSGQSKSVGFSMTVH